MELHLALRNIVKTDGPSIITEGRLVNILCDFQAFDDIPASKYVMRAIIDDGYSKKLLQCAKWDIAAQQLSGQFASSTGFQPDIVWTIFQSLAYGLGWINTIQDASNVAPAQNNPKPANNGRKHSQDPVKNLINLVEIRDAEIKQKGMSISNIEFQLSGDYLLGYIEVNCNTKNFFANLFVAVFSNEGILSQEMTCVTGFAIKKYFFNDLASRVQDITRILIYTA